MYQTSREETEMNSKIQERAEKIYNTTRLSAAQIAFCGEETLRKSQPISFATVEEIAAWLETIEEARVENELPYLDETKIPYGSSRTEIFQIASSKRKASNRRAGVRALEAKYGHEVADKIVNKHSGRHIR